MIPILYEDNHLLVVEKPVNIPVQQDDSKDEDVLSICKACLKETYQKPGNVYLGLVHRLDRPVGGVMVFAKTSKAAARLSKQIQTHEVQKTYLAILDGIVENKEGVLEDYLWKDKKTNKVSVVDASKGQLARLSYRVLQEHQQRSLVEIQLETGRSHQIRVQFASRNLPLVNDQRYHPHPQKGQIALWAYRLGLTHPVQKKWMEWTSNPPTHEPWIAFKGKGL